MTELEIVCRRVRVEFAISVVKLLFINILKNYTSSHLRRGVFVGTFLIYA